MNPDMHSTEVITEQALGGEYTAKSDAGAVRDQKARIHRLCHSADVLRVRGQYAEAEPLYLQALALAEESFGHDDFEASIICNNLAVLYKYMGKFDEAERLYRRAPAITEQTLGSDHTELATIYHNLGGLEPARSNFAAGEPFARRAVEIRERKLGPDHVDTAADMAALAGARSWVLPSVLSL